MLLKIGTKNDDVKKLQSKLGLSDDGIFGKDTELAVKEWQRNHGLVDDGIVGNNTWNKMFNVQEEQINEISEIPHNNEIDLNKLRGFVPDSVLLEMRDTLKIFQINTPLRIAHFLSQCGHESGGFKFVRENLNYPADGLLKVFKKYFNEDNVGKYARNPEKIGSRVYANRMGNGDEESGDGYKFRGRGYLQITGKENYREFGKVIEVDIVNNPDLIATNYPLLSAAWFFKTRGLITMSDKGPGVDVITSITLRVNGGKNGLDDRIQRFNKIYQAIK